MKFAAILIGAVIAFETEADVQAKIGQIIQRNQLTAQKAELLKSLESIDTQLEAAATTPAATPAAATPSANATGNATGNATAAAADSSCTPMVIGGVVAAALLVGAGVYFYKKRQTSEVNEGGSDDLYQKFLSQELSA